MIQVVHPGPAPDPGTIHEILSRAGVEVDKAYGPIPVDPARGHYVVRGVATDDARKRAEAHPGVQFFADPQIEPMGPPQPKKGRGR